ncbi:hypothetical protein NKDENANG_03546 [Candidatus Entotheonellaceae bacterium PAL068K]
MGREWRTDEARPPFSILPQLLAAVQVTERPAGRLEPVCREAFGEFCEVERLGFEVTIIRRN